MVHNLYWRQIILLIDQMGMEIEKFRKPHWEGYLVQIVDLREVPPNGSSYVIRDVNLSI